MKEVIYLLHILENPSYFGKIKVNFFTDDLIKKVYISAEKFYNQFGEIPDNYKKQLTLNVLESNEDVTDNELKALFREDVNDYELEWRKTSIESWSKWQSFQDQLMTGVEYCKLQEVRPDNIDDVINKTLSLMSDDILAFDDDIGLDFSDISARNIVETDTVKTGKNFVNNLLGGGYEKKTLICYMGQQGVGKSIWLCGDAAYYLSIGKNVLYISGEMSEKNVMKRIDVNLLNIPLPKYKVISQDISAMTEKYEVMDPYGKFGKLFVKQMADPSVNDITTYGKTVEKYIGQKIDVIIVDYVGVMKNQRNPNSENLYLNGKQISKDLRDTCIKNDWLCITGSQIGKEAWDKATYSISAVAESSGLAHNCDLMYGIIQDSQMHEKNEYWLKILKIRDGAGKNTKCKFTINYDFMRLKETREIINE